MLRVVVLAAIAAAAVVAGSSAAQAAAPVFPTSDNTPVQNESATVTLLAVGVGQTRVGPPVRAVDADGDTLTYSLSDGTPGHASFFTIDTSSGQISLGSNTGRGVYRVRVSASDGTDMVAVDVTIHVTSGSSRGVDSWVRDRSLTASDGSSNDDFGYSLDATNDVIVIGAPLADYDTATDPGAAYVFNASTGAQLAKLTTPGIRFSLNPSVRRNRGHFGHSVAVAGDWIFVGAPNERVATIGLASRGNVYVFKKPGTGWSNTGTATATLSWGTSQIRFGYSVAVSDDGNTLVVGAPWENGSRGAVRVFTKASSANWTSSATGVTLHAGSRRVASAHFGNRVAISGDGSTIAASAPDGTVDQVFNRGVVHVFAKPATGWTATANNTVVPRLSVATASRRQGLGNLGLALSSDGSTLVAGAAVPWRKGETDDSSIPADAYGSAYVYVKPSTAWADATETAELGSFGHKYDYFGRGMAISASGNKIAVGNPWSRSSNYRGSVYVYSKPSSGGWVDDLDGAGANLRVLTLEDADSNSNHRYAFGGLGLAFIGENKLVAGQSGRVEALVQKDELSTLPSGGLYGANADHSSATNIRKGSAHLFSFTQNAAPVFPTADNAPVQNESATVTLLAVGEGQTKVGPPVRAVDADGQALTYSLSDGSLGHASFFTIDSSSGQISLGLNTGRGVYRVRVSASDGGPVTATVDVTIHVTSPGRYLWEDSWAQARSLTAGDGTSNDDFGYSLDATDEVIVVGARYSGSNNAGAAYVFDASAGAQLAKLTSPNAAANGNFGTSVAVAGDTIFVSAVFENSSRGRVYVFAKPAEGWDDSSTARATLTPAAAHSGQVLFGASVAVSDDGNTLAVGMSGHSTASGAVLVFTKLPTGWADADSDATGVVMLHAGTRIANGTYFGNAVAVSGDGNTIAAAAPYVSNRRGAVYVFTKPAAGWAATLGTEVVSQLTVDGAFRDQQLGIWGSLGLSSDGSTLVAGAPVEWRKGDSADSEIPADAYGSAYVYVRPSDGWDDATETAELGSFGHKYDHFGRGVAISASGDKIAVGNPWSRSSNYRGSVYVYSKPSSGGWVDDLDGAGANLRVLTLEDADSNSNHRYAFGGLGLAFIGENKLVAGQSGRVEALVQKDELSALPAGGLYGANDDHSSAANIPKGSAHLFTLRPVPSELQQPSAPQQPPPPPPPPPAGGPDDETTPDGFTDVSEDSPHAQSIEKVAALGITSGTGAGTFSPSESVTRAQMATFLARTWEAATGRECPSSGAASFGDVDSGSTHAAGIDCVSALGVAAGTTAAAFSPTAPVTRAQMATFLARAWAAAGRECSADAAGAFFDDVPADSTHAAGIGCIAALGITRGTAAGTFSPSDTLTRAQMATFLARFHEALTTLTPPTGS